MRVANFQAVKQLPPQLTWSRSAKAAPLTGDHNGKGIEHGNGFNTETGDRTAAWTLPARFAAWPRPTNRRLVSQRDRRTQDSFFIPVTVELVRSHLGPRDTSPADGRSGHNSMRSQYRSPVSSSEKIDPVKLWCVSFDEHNLPPDLSRIAHEEKLGNSPEEFRSSSLVRA